MFIHLGEDTMIRTKEVVMIFDYDLFTNAQHNHAYLNENSKGMEVVDVGGLTKSVVMTDTSIYLSPFSPLTLKRRSQHFSVSE